MPTTSPDNIYYADVGAPSNDVSVSATTATSVQVALSQRQVRGWRVNSQAAQDALIGMQVGDSAIRTDTGWTYRYNGTAWRPWDSSWLAYLPVLTNITLGAGTRSGRYQFRAGHCYVEGRFTIQAGSVVGVQPRVDHPAGLLVDAASVTDPYPLGRADVLKFGSAIYPGFSTTNNRNDSATFNIINASGTYGVSQTLNAGVPIVYAATDVIAWKYDFTPS